MTPNTLSGAFNARLSRPAQPTVRAPLAARHPGTRSVLSSPFAQRAMRAPFPARPEPASLTDADALLIALRRCLASCKDTNQLRMLAAFENPSRAGQ